MTDVFYLIPIALVLGAMGLAAFMWTLKSGQYDDLEGAAERILFNETDKPIVDAKQPASTSEDGSSHLSSTN
jgi:cbb3-type cytochrome oxidase maturation protein